MIEVLYVLIILYLTFMYSLNQSIILKIVNDDDKKKQFVYINYFIFWFILVLVIMVIIYSYFSIPLKLPNEYLSIKKLY